MLNFKSYNLTSSGSFYLELPSFSSNFTNSFQVDKSILNLNLINKEKGNDEKLKTHKKICNYLFKIVENKNIILCDSLSGINSSSKNKGKGYYLINSQISSLNKSRQLKDPNIWKLNKSDILSNSFWTGSKGKRDDKIIDQVAKFYQKN